MVSQQPEVHALGSVAVEQREALGHREPAHLGTTLDWEEQQLSSRFPVIDGDPEVAEPAVLFFYGLAEPEFHDQVVFPDFDVTYCLVVRVGHSQHQASVSIDTVILTPPQAS